MHNLSVLFQGPLDKENIRNINKTKNNLGDVNIVVSTWENSNIQGLYCDEIIFNQDPGSQGFYHSNSKIMNNANRQIRSTINGLKKIKTKFVVKMRTDMFFYNKKILRNIEKIKKIEKFENRLFQNKVVSLSNVSKNPNRPSRMLFHLTDFFMFGLTSDLIEYFDIEEISFDEINYFKNNPVPKKAWHKSLLQKYSNEQYFLVKLIEKKLGYIPIDNAHDFNEEKNQNHSNIVSTNFNLIHSKRLGVNCSKHPLKVYRNNELIYTEKEFINLMNNKFFFDIERLTYSIINLLKKLLYAKKNF